LLFFLKKIDLVQSHVVISVWGTFLPCAKRIAEQSVLGRLFVLGRSGGGSRMIPFHLYLSPLVVAERLPLLWWEAMGGNSLGPRESHRMVSEKLEATQHGMIAAHQEWASSGLRGALALMRGNPLEAAHILGGASSRIASAALSPAARKVKANVKRLSKT
jgi:hypothetical protein